MPLIQKQILGVITDKNGVKNILFDTGGTKPFVFREFK